MSGPDEADETDADRTVGYKRPPSRTQFAKGKSGNPHGRPKGRRNVANLTKELLSQLVTVRSGGATQEMASAEAIFRVLANKASQGDNKAIALVAKLCEMAGHASTVTDEEREQRGMRLPRPFTLEEQDLLQAPALERDLQRYLAMAESGLDSLEAEESPFAITADLKRGDELAAKRKFNDALAAYRCELDRCRTELSANPDQTAAQYNFRRTVARIGLLANTLLFEGRFEPALEIADEAIRESESEFWVDVPEDPTGAIIFWHPNKVWLQLIRAQALLFLNRWQEAENFFLHFNTGWRECVYTSWELTIMRDFVEFRRKGYVHPVMARVEGHYYQAGWVRDRKDVQPTIDPTFCHAAEITTADSFSHKGRLTEAAALYRRVLEKCESAIAGEENNRETRAQLYLVADRIGRLAERSLLAGGYADALECADQALQYDPYSTSFNLTRAHSLMLLRRTDEARAIYVTYAKKRMPIAKTGEHLIRNDFEKLREAGHVSKLMDDMERHFKEALWNQKSDQVDGVKRRDNPRPGADYRPAVKHPITAASTAPIPLHEREDLQAGQELLLQGKFAEALAVLRRCIGNCQRSLASGRKIQASDDLHTAIRGVSAVALGFILAGEHQQAIEATEFALSIVPTSHWAMLRRAHAWMFLNNPQEAREVYLRYRAEKITPEQTGSDVVLEDFERMRRSDQVTPLMDEIETMFRQPSANARTLMR